MKHLTCCQLTILFISIFVYFGISVTAFDISRYRADIETLTVDEYAKIHYMVSNTNLTQMEITCGIITECLWGTCLLNSPFPDVTYQQDTRSEEKCQPSTKCRCERSARNETDSVKIVYDNKTHVEILKSSSMVQTVSIGDNVTYYMYFTATCCKENNLAIHRGLQNLDDGNWTYPILKDRKDWLNDGIIKMNLTIFNVQVSDAGYYEMKIQVDDVLIIYPLKLYVSSNFIIKEIKIVDVAENRTHNTSTFWRPWNIYNVCCLVEDGFLREHSFEAYKKDCSLATDCKWKRVNDEQQLIVKVGQFEKMAILNINATDNVQSYRITFANNTCVIGQYYPSFVPNGISVSVPLAFRGKDVEIKCLFDQRYFKFSVLEIRYAGKQITSKLYMNETLGRRSLINSETPTGSTSTLTLTIKNLTINNNGMYEWLFERKNETRDLFANHQLRISTVVNVLDPIVPFFIETSNKIIHINDGQPQSLKCVGGGNPKPNTTWYDKSGEVIGNGTDINITSMTSEYQCQIHNQFGNQSKTFHVIAPSQSLKMIIIIIILAIVVLLLIILGVYQFRKLMQQKHLKAELYKLKTSIFSSDFDFRRLLGDRYALNIGVENKLYIDPNAYIKKDCLTIYPHKQLGRGCFGVVCQGLLRCDNRDDTIPVAVKLPILGDNIQHYLALIAEVMIMSNIGSHVNLLDVYGAVVENLNVGELFVVFEYCQKGSLLSYLKSKCFEDELPSGYENIYLMGKFDYTDDQLSEEMFCLSDLNGVRGYPFNKQVIFTCNLVQYAYQIADGMSYISRYVVHRDLALRNMLLTNNHVVKIADFGLALDKVFNPKMSDAERLPIKWMPPEAIHSKDFSVYSDVWSFGVLLWELFTLGMEPFEECRINETLLKTFYNKLMTGTRLTCPYYAPPIMYTLMKECWEIKKEERPSFEKCKKICGCYLKETFPLASEVLLNLLKHSQPYVNVKQSLNRQRVPSEEDFTYLKVIKENSYINV